MDGMAIRWLVNNKGLLGTFISIILVALLIIIFKIDIINTKYMLSVKYLLSYQLEFISILEYQECCSTLHGHLKSKNNIIKSFQLL